MLSAPLRLAFARRLSRRARQELSASERLLLEEKARTSASGSLLLEEKVVAERPDEVEKTAHSNNVTAIIVNDSTLIRAASPPTFPTTGEGEL